MKRFCVLGLLLLAACTGSVCDPPYIRHGADCCLDADRDGACDTQAVEAKASPVEETSPIEVSEPAPSVETPEEPPAPQPVMQRFLDEYDEKVRTFGYWTDTREYGELDVLHTDNLTKYVARERLFEIEQGNKTVRPSKRHVSERLSEEDEDEIRYWELLVMNYIVRDGERYVGCYVLRGYRKLENCIGQSTGKPVVHPDLDFSPPKSPMDWLREFKDAEPAMVREDRLYRSDNSQFQVDEYTFPSGGREVKMYLHSTYRVPLKVEVLENGRTVGKTEYRDPSFNAQGLSTWHIASLEK